MQRFPTFLIVLLLHYAFSVRCSPEDILYQDSLPNLGDDELFASLYDDFSLYDDSSPHDDSSPYDDSSLYDNSSSNFQPLLDSAPNLISAGVEETCSDFDLTPNGKKVRARETQCPAEQHKSATDLDIPSIDIFQDTNYLCPFEMNLGLKVLVCGKPVSIDGLTPDVLTTVQDARLCKFPRKHLEKRTLFSAFASFFFKRNKK